MACEGKQAETTGYKSNVEIGGREPKMRKYVQAI